MPSVLLVFAALALASHSGQEGTSFDAQVRHLRQVAQGSDDNRFEEIVRFIERTKSDAEAKIGMDVLGEAVKAFEKKLEGFRGLPNEDYWARYQELSKPLTPNQELIQVSPEVAIETARSLFAASKTERQQLIKKLSAKAGEDWKLKDDETYFGPRCGTYDHTHELMIQWAARRYRAEAIETLGQGSWDGRRKLMIALGDYERGQTEAKLKPILIRLSYGPNTLVRGEALLSLGRYPGEDTEKTIQHALSNKAADTRAKALYTAATLKLACAETMGIRLVNDPVYDVQEAAIHYLGAVGTPAAKSKLIASLKEENLLWRTLDAIAEAKCSEATPYLVDLLSKKSQEGKSGILETLVAVDAAQGAQEIESALKSTDEDLLMTAINLVGKVKLLSARSAVQKFLSHSDKYIRQVAANALQELDK